MHNEVTDADDTSDRAGLARILEHLDEGLSLVDADLNVAAFNSRFLDMLDLPADRFRPGMPMEAFLRFNARRGEYGPGDVEQHVRQRLDHVRRGVPQRFDRVRPDGAMIEIRGWPLPGGDFLFVYTDVTERRRAEAALRASEARFRDLIDGAVQGILIHRTWVPVYANQAYADLLGYATPGDVIALGGMERIYAPEEHERLKAFQAARKRGGEAPSRYEIKVIRADGTRRTLLNVVRAVEWEGAFAIQHNVVDVTQERLAREALRLVSGLTEQLARARRLEDGAVEVLRRIAQHLGARVGEAWSPDPGTQVLRRVATWNAASEALDAFVAAGRHALGRGEGITGSAWSRREVIWVADVTGRDGAFVRRRAEIERAGLRTVCAIPVEAEGNVAIVLTLFMEDAGDAHAGTIEALRSAAAPVAAFLQRLAAEERGRAAEARLELALEAAGVGTWDFEPDTGRVHWDRHMGPLFGRAPGYVPASFDAFLELVHPDDGHKIPQVVAGDGFSYDLRVLWPDGGVHVLQARGRARDGAMGAGRAILAATWDVTAESRAADRIADLARIPEETPHPVLRIAADGTLLLANPGAAALLAPGAARVGGPAPPEMAALAAGALAAGTESATEVQAGGRSYRLKLCPVSVRQYVNVYGEDVTEQQAVRRRLDEVQRLAAAGELMGGIAHEFNNRLTTVLGSLELLREQLAGDSKARRLAENAHRVAGGCAALTRDLLSYAQRQMLQVEAVDPNVLIEGARDRLTVGDGGVVVVELDLQPGVWPVRTDPAQLAHALEYLARNAHESMRGGGRLTVATANVPGDRGTGLTTDRVRITVTDTGEGMTDDVRGRALEPFFTTRGRASAMGLGLSMVHGLVRQCGGTLALHSQPGRGTRVEMLFLRAGAGEVVVAATAGGPVGFETVLVADDDAIQRRVAADSLRDMGYRVEEAPGAADALEALGRIPHLDLLVADVMMRGAMSGAELVRAARALRPGLPVILASGAVSAAHDDCLPAMPAEARLGKPYTGEALAAAVRRILHYAVHSEMP